MTGEMKNKMQEVYELIKSCKTYFLATDDKGQPRVRPFGTIHVFDGKLYILTGRSKNVAQQLLANPNAEICAFDGTKWIRVTGKLVPDDRREAKKSMLDAFPHLRHTYSEDDENTVVFGFEDATAVISSFTEAPKTITI